MLQKHLAVADENVPDSKLPLRTGSEVAHELGGRLLIRYVTRHEAESRRASGTPLTGLSRRAWVTLTAYTPKEAVSALALPNPTIPRTHAVLLKADQIATLKGPRRVLAGTGVEYLLPDGYPKEALFFPWELEVR